MKKQDLKNGAVVETRNGYRYIKVDNTFINIENGNYMKVCSYNDDLIHDNREWDIVKVNNNVDNNGYCNFALFNVLGNNKWTWNRKEIKLHEDEKAILKNLLPKYKWIARDEDGTLYIFNEFEPFKDQSIWRNGRDSWEFSFFNHLFQFIKWEDEEPYSIDELLKGVE